MVPLDSMVLFMCYALLYFLTYGGFLKIGAQLLLAVDLCTHLHLM